ncbi:hypothetical protein [Candidatus Nitrosotenuis aquarius]|uniref:hypothetical protein n=1 Tax=Candidatus Nitrosotenuis aquarius TaxID=1846278 RepID=UPI000C1E4610|nr:hypothetical protein [Candidatus Nitrosotenuis aquarius]
MKLAITLGLVALTILVQTGSAFAEDLVYHGKNVIESPPEFAGSAFHFIINGDKATVVSAGASGLEIVRMDIAPSEMCIQTESTLCFDGGVTEVKNPQIHQVGDLISFIIDFTNKKQIGTAKSGPMTGMTVTMNIDRMNIKSLEPYSISVSREGGFAGFAQKTMTFDSEAGMIIITEGESETNVPLDEDTIQEIDQIFQKSKLLNMDSGDYPANEGSADYFAYSLTLDQGIFQKQFTWTDASDGAPEILRELQNTIWVIGEENIPMPVDIPIYDEETITEIAREFVVSSPTFAFDGMEETLEFGSITILESFPEQHVIDATFTSSHGGYGDRTDQVVTQVLTPHIMEIIISEGAVISAVIDGEWDEMNNQFVLKAPN